MSKGVVALMSALIVIASVMLVYRAVTPDGGDPPQGTIEALDRTSPSSFRVTFGAMNPVSSYSELRYATGTDHNLSLSEQVTGDGISQTIAPMAPGDPTYSISVHDLDGDGLVDRGEYVDVASSAPLSAGSKYDFSLLFEPTGSYIATWDFVG